MIKIEDYKNGDEVEILKLFKKVFKKDLTIEYWNWRFKDNLTKQSLIKLAWEDNKLVSHYAVCPIPMIYIGESFNAALSMTTMTDPDYNGMGLFPKLANSLFEELPENKIGLVYGFPNRNSHYAFIKKLNWENICGIFQLTLANFQPSKEKYEVNEIGNISEQHIKNDENINDNFQINRDLNFYNWRYNKNPLNKYYFAEIINDNIRNFIVFKIFEINDIKHIDILELQIEDDIDLISSFVNYIHKKFRLNYESRFNIWMSVFNPQFTNMEKLGFAPKEPITYLGYKSFNFVNNLNENKVYFTMGDSDVY